MIFIPNKREEMNKKKTTIFIFRKKYLWIRKKRLFTEEVK